MRFKFLLILIVVLLFLLAAWSPLKLGWDQTVVKSGNVVNFISKLCMDPVGETPTVNGTRIQVTKCDAIADKFWEWTKDGFLRNPTSGKCLDVVGDPGTANGSALQLWDCEYDKSTTDQRWWFTPDRQLLNLHTGKCIDIPGAENYSDGALLQVWDCENGTTLTDQLWELLPAVTASNPYSGIVLPEWTRLGKCTDADRDCISDALEDTIAATFMPVFVFDEEEHNILANQNFSDFGQGNGVEYLYQVSIADCYTKVDSNSNPTSAVFQLDPFPFGSNAEHKAPRSIMFTVLEIFPYDYLPKQNILYDFSDEEDVFVHYGDVETIKFCLRDDDRNGAYTVSFIQFRRHKKEYIINATWEKEGTHMVFYASEGKHGTYSSQYECANAVDGIQLNYWAEDCAEGKPIRPKTERKYNVGEYYTGKDVSFDDLGLSTQFKNTAASAGFPYIDENIWGGPTSRLTYFCGGMDVPNYSLQREATFFYSDNTCPGSVSSRWWVEPKTSCMEQNTDRPGSDYKMIDDMIVADPSLCVRECLDDPACVAFTYVPGSLTGGKSVCYLKNAIPSPVQRNGLISGYRSNCVNGY